MNIRKACLHDFEQVYPLIFLASESVFDYFSEAPQVKKMMLKLFYETKNTRYYYENIYIYEKDNVIAGCMIFYDGQLESQYSQGQQELIKSYNGQTHQFEVEGLSTCYYLDTIAVDPSFQGQGIAHELIAYTKHITDKPVCLIVEKAKPKVKAYYERLGFVDHDEIELYDLQFDRMIRN